MHRGQPHGLPETALTSASSRPLRAALASTLVAIAAACGPRAPISPIAPPAATSTPSVATTAAPVAAPTDPAEGARVPPVPRQGILEIAVGDGVTCLRLDDGGVRCAGSNLAGRAGAGEAPLVPTPTIVAGLPPATALAVGDAHGCAIDAERRVWCWGENGYGQLGDGTTTSRGTPALVPDVDGAVEIDAARSHSCARLESGAVRCWGRALHIGDGTEETRTRPVALAGVRDAQLVVLGAENGCVLLADHTARCWGFNGGGVFGGRPGPFRRPTSVFGVAVREIALGDRHVCVVLEDGHVECAGNDSHGQLAGQSIPDDARCEDDDRTLTCTWQDPILVDPPDPPGATPRPDIWPPPPAPVRPTHTRDYPSRRGFGWAHWQGHGLVADGVYGNGRTCMITDSDEVQCFGVSSFYQGGQPDWGHRRAQPIAGLRGAAQIDVSPDHGCAVLRDGRAACWGEGRVGQLGDGGTARRVEASFVTW